MIENKPFVYNLPSNAATGSAFIYILAFIFLQ